MPYLTKVFNTQTNQLDYAIQNGQLLTGNGLPTAFLNALFSSNVTTLGLDQWWGSTYSTYPIGSRLPLLIRAVKSGANNVCAQARDYTKEALRPFLEIGVITSLDVPLPTWTNINGSNFITISIAYTEPGNTSPQLIKYGLAGDGTSFIII